MTGFRLAVGALLAQLRRHHDVRLLAFRKPDQPRQATDDTRLVAWPGGNAVEDAATFVRALTAGRPFRPDQLAAYLRGPLREELREYRPAVVQLFSESLAALGPEVAGHPSVLTIFDAWHPNVEAKLAVAPRPRRWLLRGEVRRVRRYEASDYRHFDRIVVVTEEDRQMLTALAPDLRVVVVPNGVDSERFRPGAAPVRDEHRIVFHGVLDYPPNITAAVFLARHVLPRVRHARPDAYLALVGRNPPVQVRALGRLAGVIVTGEVDDIPTWLAGSRVYACSMLTGTGIKNKLLEAMACGMACVATPRALQGLRVTPGRELLVASTPASFAERLLAILDDDALRDRLGVAARRYVVGSHTWQQMGDAYADLYEQLSGEATVRRRR